jgi:hypothetical protein
MREYLINIIAVLLSVAFVANAQTNVNYKGYGDTAQILTFKADSFKQTKAFNLTNAENKVLILNIDDTTNAGVSGDSIKCAIGYRFGFPLPALNGSMDTAWSGLIPLDTCDIVGATGLYSHLTYSGTIWSLDATTDLSQRPHSAVMSTGKGTAATAYMVIPFTPPWGAYIRFYVKGLTGNKIGATIKTRVTFEQRGWIPVKQM